MTYGPANFAVDTDYPMPWLSLHGLGRTPLVPIAPAPVFKPVLPAPKPVYGPWPAMDLPLPDRTGVFNFPSGTLPLPFRTVLPKLHGFSDYVDGLGDLAISVDVKIPKPITEAAKILPSIAHQFPQYAKELEKQAAAVTGTVDAVNIGLQSLGVAVIFGGIIFILLSREKGK